MSAYISETDARIFREGIAAAKAYRWTKVEQATSKINDPVAKDILRWVQATNNKNVSIDTLEYVHRNLSDWPRMSRVGAESERRMFNENWGPNRVLSWFSGDSEPISGEGRAALAGAHYATQNPTQGDAYLRLAWRESRLTRDGQKKLYRLYKNKLTKEDHAARADHLIWSGYRHYDKAQALLQFMSKTDRALMNARMKINRNASGMNLSLIHI